MAEPLSTTASVIAVLQLSAAATQYLKDFKHGSVDRLRLRDELRNTICLLEMLRDRIEDVEYAGDEALKPTSLESLGAPDGPLSLFKRILEDIIKKLTPHDKLRKLTQPFVWPFDKKDIAEMLAALERLKTHFNLIMQNDLVALAKISNLKLDEIGEHVQSLETKRRDDDSEKILTWLSPISFRSKQADVFEGVQQGTGKWFLEHNHFLNWVNGEIQMLWCPGIPGAGKTSLVALTIALLEGQFTQSETTFAYFYCDYKQREAQTPMSLLSSLLEQVIRRASCESLPSEVVSLYNLHKKYDTRPTLSQIGDALRKTCAPYKTIHVVIDALDECTESEESALEFISAVLALGPNVKLLCTSRFSTTFNAFFNQAERLEIYAQSEDIRMFLESRVRQQSRLSRHVRADPNLEEEITKTIIEESHGMFLLATLHFESLSRKITRKDVRMSLQTLPKTLDDTYDQALTRIRSQAEEDVELAEMVLFWMLCAKRTLTVLELQHMYAVKALSGEEVALEDEDLPDGEILTGVCGGLVVVDGESNSIRLVHYTAQQYFERVHQDRLPSARLDITRISLAYLRLPNFSSGICTADDAMSARLAQYPFLDYAAHHWGSESASVNFDDLWDDLESFFRTQSAVDVANQVWSIPQHRYTHWSQEFPRNVPAVVLAASFDLPTTLRRLITKGHDLEGKGSDDETPLVRAARLGLTANVIVLLELGAAVDATDSAGETALDRAAASGNAGVVRALLHWGADLTLKSAGNWTILMSAVTGGNIDVVRLLIEAGADMTTQTERGDSALSIATRNGQERIATLLADCGATLPDTVAGRRASVVAARKGLRRLVRRLTADYTTVAKTGLQRQQPVFRGDMAAVPEDENLVEPNTETGSVTNTLDRDALTQDQEIGDLYEALDGFPYTRGFQRRYDLEEKLGKGVFASIFLCKNKVTGVAYAAKHLTFSRSVGKKTAFNGLRAEIQSLTELRHQSILRLVDIMVEDTVDELYLVTELAQEGDFFNWIVTKGKLTETETRKVYTQLLSALEFMHEQGWIHRDVKPENVLVCDKNLTVKLADFGLAKYLRDKFHTEELCTTLCGTPSYVAPEVLQNSTFRKYNFSVDVWSAGVVLYICLCGFPPFSDELYSSENPYTLAQQIKMGRFDYPSPYWDPIGDPALDLIDRMLTVDVQRRITVKQCMEHPWMTEINGNVAS